MQSVALAAAVAALVLLAVRLARVPVEIEPQPDARAAVDADPGAGVALVFPALDLPRAPADFALPAAPSLTFAAPSFPMLDRATDSKSTTKEST